MRPTISWAELAGARVGVWGLGVEGDANLRKLRQLAVEPVLVDDAPDESALARGALATSHGGLDALLSCDVVVKTPGISRYRDDAAALVAAGVTLAGGLGLWMQEVDRERVICITGTKGKSTTTSMLGHLLERLGRRCVVGGNIGRPPWDPDVPADADVWVIETSSYQATDVASSPPIVAVTSLHADHLNWHGDAETYYRDKLSLCAQPGADLTIANGADPLLRDHRDQLGPRVEWVEANATPPSWAEAFGLRGAHNRLNAAIAQRVLVAFGDDASDDDL
jgi:UDP-N-acetylmuramoylalanine--D-glutamate ligase